MFQPGNKAAVGHGRPKIDRDDLLDKYLSYIASKDDPHVEGFCVLADISKQTFYDIEKEDKRFSDAKQKADTKSAAFLLDDTKMNVVWKIFRGKQPNIGMVDKQEVKLDGNITQTIKPIIQD